MVGNSGIRDKDRLAALAARHPVWFSRNGGQESLEPGSNGGIGRDFLADEAQQEVNLRRRGPALSRGNGTESVGARVGRLPQAGDFLPDPVLRIHPRHGAARAQVDQLRAPAEPRPTVDDRSSVPSRNPTDTRCLVPGSRDATLTREAEEALWQAASTAAPEQRRKFEPSSKRRKRRLAPWPAAAA